MSDEDLLRYLSRPLKVLVVEDEAPVRELIRLCLQSFNVELEEAESGEQAIALIERTDFQVVILDLRLPGLSGIEVFRTIRARSKKVRVVITSGYITSHTFSEIQQIGIATVVQKPLQLTKEWFVEIFSQFGFPEKKLFSRT